MADYASLAQVALLFPFLPRELLAVFVDGYVEYGDADLATAAMRQSSAYDTYFAGNRRPDGTLRFSEADYASYRDLFNVTLASINVNPYLFSDHFVDLIEGDVSSTEFTERIDAIYERVIDQGPAIRQAYAQYSNVLMTDSAILASALDPTIGRMILNNQITMAEVGGEAAMRGFGLDLDMSRDLVRQGINRSGAQEVFGAAAQQLPILDVLARRHSDPDDDFDINEFLSAAIFDDPFERQRMRRLVAQERGLYTQSGFARTGGGEVTGLMAR